jgi:hypothetical protein
VLPISEDEALERPQLLHVPHAAARDRLLLVELLGERGVEAPEVDQLARRVDLRLVAGLRLSEHGRRVEALPPRGGQQLGGAQEHRGPRLPAHRRPLAAAVLGGQHRAAHHVGVRHVEAADHLAVVVRHHDRVDAAGVHPLAADDAGDLDLLAGLARQLGLERRALGAARCVAEDRLVDGGRDGDHGVVHGRRLPWRCRWGGHAAIDTAAVTLRGARL